MFFSIPKFLSQQVKDAEICRRKWEDHNIYYNIYYFIDNVAVILVSLMFLVVLYTKMCYSIALHQKDLKNLSSYDVGNYHNQIHHHLRREKNTKMIAVSAIPLGIRRCFDVDIRLKQHCDVDNEISTLFQRCSQGVASTL